MLGSKLGRLCPWQSLVKICAYEASYARCLSSFSGRRKFPASDAHEMQHLVNGSANASKLHSLACNPIHKMSKRCYETKTDKPPIRDFLINNTFRYSFQFMFAVLREPAIFKLIVYPFVFGVKSAFLFVTNNIVNKTYDDLAGAVSDELLLKIKSEADIKSSRAHLTSLGNSDVFQISLYDLNFLKNMTDRTRTLQIKARIAFVKDKEHWKPPPPSEFFHALLENDLKKAPLQFADYTFLRMISEDVDQSSPWIVTAVWYYTYRDKHPRLFSFMKEKW